MVARHVEDARRRHHVHAGRRRRQYLTATKVSPTSPATMIASFMYAGLRGRRRLGPRMVVVHIDGESLRSGRPVRVALERSTRRL